MADRYFDVEGELAGKGRVYDGTEEIAAARYKLQILHLKTQTGNGVIDGRLTDIEGHIIPINKAIGDLFRRNKLTLKFEGGKELDFYIKNGGTGQIQALGSIRD